MNLATSPHFRAAAPTLILTPVRESLGIYRRGSKFTLAELAETGPFSSYLPFGGSFHCATLDIRRRGWLQNYF
jgi:hypothetical protein